jgi:hypothetical protein
MSVNLFDANYYRSVNSDLQQFNDEQAFEHLLNFGLNENRQFSRIVNLDIYRANNPDLAIAGLTTNRQLFDHLQEFGVKEGRKFSDVLDLTFYQANNADLANFTSEQLFQHFQDYGLNEGRLGASTVNTSLAINSASTTPYIIPPVIPPMYSGNTSPPGSLPIAPNTELPSFDPVGTDTGDVLNASIDMAVNNFNMSLNESVGNSDPNDYYRFVVSNYSQFNLTLSGSSVGMEMYIDRNNDGQLATEELFITGASGLSGAPNDYTGARTSFSGTLSSGNYYVRIFTELERSDYQLDLSNNPTYYPYYPPYMSVDPPVAV